ncbi:MAG: YaaR family protein [Selenomonadaceae bacterium]
MKIDAVNTQRTLPTVEHEASTHVKGTESDFSSELSQSQGNMSMEEMQKLLDKIDKQGAKLTQTPTYDELKSYRDLVKTFVGEAVSRMYTLNSQSGWDRMGRQKVYTSVRKIDKKLEEMAEDIRLGQADQLGIIAKQDAIRGMLVDIYM